MKKKKDFISNKRKAFFINFPVRAFMVIKQKKGGNVNSSHLIM